MSKLKTFLAIVLWAVAVVGIAAVFALQAPHPKSPPGATADGGQPTDAAPVTAPPRGATTSCWSARICCDAAANHEHWCHACAVLLDQNGREVRRRHFWSADVMVAYINVETSKNRELAICEDD